MADSTCPLIEGKMGITRARFPVMGNIFRLKVFIVFGWAMLCVHNLYAEGYQASQEDPLYFFSPPLEINATVGFFRIGHDISFRTRQNLPSTFVSQLKWLLNASGLFNPDAVNPTYHLSFKDSLFFGLEASFTNDAGDLIYSGLVAAKKTLPEQEAEFIKFIEKASRAFESQRSVFESALLVVENKSDQSTRIVLTDFWGKKRWVLIDDGELNTLPVWSPDGKKFLYTQISQEGTKVVVFDIPTLRGRPLSLPGHSTGGSWTSDMKKVIVTNSYQDFTNLVSLDLKTGLTQKLTNTLYISTGGDLQGKKLLFTSDRSVGVQIYARDDYSLTTDNYRMTYLGLYNSEPHWSNAGNMFAFTTRLAGVFQIYVMSNDGRRVKAMTQGPTDHFHPVFAPDDRQVLYVEKEGDRSSLVFQLLDGSFRRNLPSDANIRSAAWSGAFDWSYYP